MDFFYLMLLKCLLSVRFDFYEAEETYFEMWNFYVHGTFFMLISMAIFRMKSLCDDFISIDIEHWEFWASYYFELK